MITKSRLKELITQNAVVYTLKENELYRISLNLDLYEKIGVDEKFLYIKDYSFIDRIPFENLYEIEKQVKGTLEYQHIPRIEWLDLPTWEEFMQEDKIIAFTAYPYNYHLLKYGNFVVIKSFYGCGTMNIFMEPLTEENYTKACDLCVKLFRGEYDDDRN